MTKRTAASSSAPLLAQPAFHQASTDLAADTGVPPDAPSGSHCPLCGRFTASGHCHNRQCLGWWQPGREQAAPVPPAPAIFATIAQQAGLAEAALRELWQTAADYKPPAGPDPYCRWQTHRWAVEHLGQWVQLGRAMDMLTARETSGYAALLWPLVVHDLQETTSLAADLRQTASEPSHVTCQPHTAYVPVCITVYPGTNLGWNLFLTAAIEDESQPWATIAQRMASSLPTLARQLEELYLLALDEVDIPEYLAAEHKPPLCPTCHRLCGWDGTCQFCHPAVEPAPDREWAKLEKGALTATLAVLPRQPTMSRLTLGHPAVQVALVALKARRGHAVVEEALDLVRGLRTPTLPSILRKAHFTLRETASVLAALPEAGWSLAPALRTVLCCPQPGRIRRGHGG